MNLLVLHMISITIEIFLDFYVCSIIAEEKQKISAVFIVVAVISYLMNFSMAYLEAPVYINNIKSVAVFLMIAIIVYKMKISKAVLIDVLFLICSYISDILTTIILSYILGDTYDNIPLTDTGMAVGMFLTDFLLFILITTIVHLFNKKYRDLPIKYWVFIVFCYMLSFAVVFVIDTLSIMAELSNLMIIVIPSAAMICLNVVLLNIFQGYSDSIQLGIMRQIEKNNIENYKILEESEREIHILRHDMKNHIASMRYLLDNNNIDEAKKYLLSMSDTVERKGFSIYTNNTTLDAILNTKSRLAAEKGIKYTVKTNINEILNIDPIDISIILGNALDNAIEGSIETENKFISATIEKKGNELTILIYNSSPLRNTSDNGSTKSDKKNHGLGIKSIKNTLKKYSGNIITSYENNMFITKISMKL